MNESEMQEIFNLPIYPRVLTITYDKEYMNKLRLKRGRDSLDLFLQKS